MHYAIIANPRAGRSTTDQKLAALAEAADLLSAPLHGLDTESREDFMQCARELAEHCDVLVAAGGDGTVSAVINALDTARRPIAYLPLGTGNALAYALDLRGSLRSSAQRILNGAIRTCDLIDCDGRARAFMASVGIDGAILAHLQRQLTAGPKRLISYLGAAWAVYFRSYRRPSARVKADGTLIATQHLLSMMVVKQPYYGFGLRVMPEARWADGRLHLRVLDGNLAAVLWGGLSAFSIGNRAGRHLAVRRASIDLDRPLPLQIDGDLGWHADHFTFRISPGALKIKC
jgi:diacylglycerol kinase family enzyme